MRPRSPTDFGQCEVTWPGLANIRFQHHQIARMRSLGFRFPTIRATNTGATMIVDAAGRVTHQLASISVAYWSGRLPRGFRVTPIPLVGGALWFGPLVAFALLVSIPFNESVFLRR